MDLDEEEVSEAASEEAWDLASGALLLPGLMWGLVEVVCRGAVTSSAALEHLRLGLMRSPLPSEHSLLMNMGLRLLRRPERRSSTT